MHKFRWKVHWKLARNLYGQVQELKWGGSCVAARAVKSQSFSTSIGCWKEPSMRLMQEQIVAALQFGERRRASTLLAEFSNGTYILSADDFQYILQYCAKSPDPSFALEIWKLIEEKEISNSGKCYILTVRALCKGGYLTEAFNMVKVLGETPGTYPILSAYNCLLSSSGHMRISYTSECLDLMEQQMVGKNHVTYAELLKLAVFQQNLSAVHEIWKECIKHYSFSIIALRKFIWSFTRLKDLGAAYAILQHMVDLATRGNITISKSIEGTLHNMRLDIPMPCKSFSSLPSCSMNNKVPVISELEYNKGLERKCLIGDGTTMTREPLSLPVMKILRWSFTDVINACAITKNYTLAEHLMSQMQTLGVKPSSLTYSGFIIAAIYEKGLHYGMEMVGASSEALGQVDVEIYQSARALHKHSLTLSILTTVNVMEKQNLKPSDSALAALSISCSKNLDLDLAEAFLNQISRSSTSHPYDTFLEACDTLDRPERAVRMLAKMKELHICPNIRTYVLMFSLFGNVNAPYEAGNMLSQVDASKRINAIEMDMMKNCIQHNSWSMKNLLKALGSEGMIEEMIRYLQVAQNLFHHQGVMTPLYNTVLHSLVEAKESDMAIEVFKHMRSCGIRGDKFTYNVMIDCCSLTKCFRSACALVSRMIRDGFNIEAITYTALIKILLVFEDFDEALKLLYQARTEGIQSDVLLYNTILQVACDKGRLDVVELIAELMHQEKVQPDPSTCSFIFTTYVDLGLHSTAMEALQVVSLRMISEEEHILEEKRAEFDHLVVAEEGTVESEMLNYFKDYQENTAFALLNLRWCATLGYPISWLPERSPWAKRLSSNYTSWSEP